MKHLHLGRLLVAALVLFSAQFTFAQTAPAADAAASIALPDLNPAEWFDGKMGGTFGAKTVTVFTKSKRVAVAGFRVVFVTHNEARAFVRASYMPGGIERGSASAKMEVDLVGVDDATMQAITDRAYKLFIEQLKATGREVITADQLQASYAGFKLATAPDTVKLGLLEGKAFTPSGVPLFWQTLDSWGDAGLSQKNMRAFNELSKSADAAITIAPMIVIDFAHMTSSGANKSGLLRRRAEVGATLAMSVPTFTTRVVRAEQTRYGGLVFKGDDGALTLTKALDTDIEFAEMVSVATQKSSMANLRGTDNVRKKSTKVAETTNEAYSAAADAVLSKATGAFAKLFAVHQPAS